MKKSVVIRGKIFEYTQESISSIREWFDGEIILSTWDNENIEHLSGYDVLVKTKDPGPGPVQQMRRQLVSYEKGLHASSGELLLVTRSDMVHYSDPFVYFDKLQDSTEAFRIFEKKLLIGNMMSINPDRGCPGEPDSAKYFRLNDWFQVGLKSDLEKWCNIIDVVDNNINADICTEQFWFASCLKKYFYEKLDLNDLSSYKGFLWAAILNNFRILNTKSTLKAENKNWASQPEDFICYLMEEEYNRKYKEFFGNFS